MRRCYQPFSHRPARLGHSLYLRTHQTTSFRPQSQHRHSITARMVVLLARRVNSYGAFRGDVFVTESKCEGSLKVVILRTVAQVSTPYVKGPGCVIWFFSAPSYLISVRQRQYQFSESRLTPLTGDSMLLAIPQEGRDTTNTYPPDHSRRKGFLSYSKKLGFLGHGNSRSMG